MKEIYMLKAYINKEEKKFYFNDYWRALEEKHHFQKQGIRSEIKTIYYNSMTGEIYL